MIGTPHRIRSLRWQVEAGSTAEALLWRTKLRQKGTEVVLPALDQALDAIASPEQVVHIPRIELRIRLQRPEEVETLLPGEIRRLLQEQLRDLLDEQARKQSMTGLPQNDAEEAPPEHSLPESPGDQNQPSRTASLERSSLAPLLHYLQTGLLPWRAAVGSAQDLAAALHATCRTFLPQIVQHLANSREAAAFYFRLLQLLPREACGLLIREHTDALAGERGAALRAGLEQLLEGTAKYSRYARLELLAAILPQTHRWRTAPEDAWSLPPMAAMAAPPPGAQPLLAHWIAELPPPTAALFRSERTPSMRTEDGHPTAVLLETVADNPSDPESRAADTTREGCPAGGSAAKNKPARSSRPETPEALFPLLVQQAGLILLHPYLVRLFEHRAVKAADSEELPPAHLPRAAALLHFLATGRDECYEYELGLSKLLLGLHPLDPLPVCAGLLTTADQAEATTLLRAMIGHWSVLKNTSIPGLRASFLERPGLVRDEANGWRLNVERRAHDLLLEQIPWNISIVRLPWMARPLFIEW